MREIKDKETLLQKKFWFWLYLVILYIWVTHVTNKLLSFYEKSLLWELNYFQDSSGVFTKISHTKNTSLVYVLQNVNMKNVKETKSGMIIVKMKKEESVPLGRGSPIRRKANYSQKSTKQSKYSSGWRKQINVVLFIFFPQMKVHWIRIHIVFCCIFIFGQFPCWRICKPRNAPTIY